MGILGKDSRISLRMEKLEMSRNSRKREHRGITTMKWSGDRGFCQKAAPWEAGRASLPRSMQGESWAAGAPAHTTSAPTLCPGCLCFFWLIFFNILKTSSVNRWRWERLPRCPGMDSPSLEIRLRFGWKLDWWFWRLFPTLTTLCLSDIKPREFPYPKRPIEKQE